MFLSVDEHGVHIDVHALHGDAGGLGDLVADLVDDTAAERLEIDAVVNRDVQAERDAAVLSELSLSMPLDIDSRRSWKTPPSLA